MSATPDTPLPQFHLDHPFLLYHPAPSIAGNASVCSISTNSAIQYQVPSPCRSSSSQLGVSPAPSWDPAETRQSWGGYEWCGQEGTYASGSRPVDQYHNQTTTINTYSFQPPRTNSYAHSQPAKFYSINQTPSFPQSYIPTLNNSSPPLLPHQHTHLPTLPPREDSAHLPLYHSFETFDLRPSLQFLASKTPPPEKPLPPPPTLVNSIPIHQRPIPPRTMSDSEIAKTDGAGPAAFACLSMDFGLSSGMPDPGTKSCETCGSIL